MHVAVGQAAAAEPPGAQSARPAAAKEVVEQPSAAAATPRSPEPPEAPPETERIPATPVESCFDCLIFGAFCIVFLFFSVPCVGCVFFTVLLCCSSYYLCPAALDANFVFMLANLEPWNL